MADYLPSSDLAFLAWLENFSAAIATNLSGYGLSATDQTALTGAIGSLQNELTNQQTALANSQAATENKDLSRRNAEDLVGPMVRRVQATPTVTDPMRELAGITVTDSQPTPSGPPTTAPVGRVDTSQRLQHTVHFTDSATPTSKARPAGVRGCEIWMKVGAPPPAGASELDFVTLDSRTPHTIPFDAADGGQPVTYWLRWVSNRGEAGPWSAAVTATVPG
jgi:hypothetical protein